MSINETVNANLNTNHSHNINNHDSGDDSSDDSSNIAITHTKFIDTNSEDVVDINADLVGEAVLLYNDENSGPTSILYKLVHKELME